MKLGKLYELIVKIGMEADPRPKTKVREGLNQAKKVYRKLKGGKKAAFDKEKLSNPYADTRIICGDKNRKVKTIMVGIDMGGEELLLCDRLNQSSRTVDLVMSHHPHGRALTRLPQVMEMQSDILNKLGIPIDVARRLMAERIEEAERSFQSRNYSRYVDFARLLNIPYICCHTVADNHVTSYLEGLISKARPKKLKDVLSVLNRIPEYKQAADIDAGPKIIFGKSDDTAGKVFIDMTGGTEGSKKIYARLSQAGVKTLICMHLSEQHLKVAKSEYINLIMAGHIASDNIGMNLFLDKLAKAESFEFISCSGFKRIER